jgi:hypothetical protein
MLTWQCDEVYRLYEHSFDGSDAALSSLNVMRESWSCTSHESLSSSAPWTWMLDVI